MRWRLGFSGCGRPAPSPASAPGSITNELVKAGEGAGHHHDQGWLTLSCKQWVGHGEGQRGPLSSLCGWRGLEPAQLVRPPVKMLRRIVR